MEAALQGPSGRTVLGTGIFTIGRAADNQLVVNDSKASSHHAEMRLVGQSYTITDLGSTNGTFVNEQWLDRNIPRLLNAGDAIRIGDTTFIYEVSGAQVAPTVYAKPDQENNPAYQPTVPAAPPSFTDYSSNAQQGYQPPLPPPAYAPFAPPPPQPAYGQPAYAPPAALPGVPGYAPPVQARKKSRRGLWITLAIIIVVLVIACGAIIYVGRSTPAKTLNTFCNAVKSGDAQTAYNQLSQSNQSRISEQVFASAFSHFSSCTYGSISESDPNATAPITFFSTAGGSLNAQVNLVQDNGGVWKIAAIRFAR